MDKQIQTELNIASTTRQATASVGAHSQYVVFLIEGEEYCIEILNVQEIIRMVPVTWLPKRAEYIIGVINLRGEIIPVIDLRIKFGLSRKDYTKFTRILIGQVAERQVGMVVDGVNEVVAVPGENIEAAPGMVSRSKSAEYIKGIAKIEERVIVMLDLEKVLANEDIISMNEVSLPAQPVQPG